MDNKLTRLRAENAHYKRLLAFVDDDIARILAENITLKDTLGQKKRQLESYTAALVGRDRLIRAIEDVTTDPAVIQAIRRAREDPQ